MSNKDERGSCRRCKALLLDSYTETRQRREANPQSRSFFFRTCLSIRNSIMWRQFHLTGRTRQN